MTDHITDESLVREMLSDISHPLWTRRDPMPPWLTSFRPHQTDAILQINEAFADTPITFLDAPVGSGKTVIADMIHRLLGGRSVYICTTKTLQHQFERDFSHAKLLKGRNNYPTEYGAFPEVTAADCTADPGNPECMFCSSKIMCRYEQDKQAALRASIAVLNTAYYLTEANGPGRFGEHGGRDLGIMDEADTLESALMSHVEVEIGQWWRRQLGIDLPRVKTEKAKSNDWQDWAEMALSAAKDYRERLPQPRGNVKALRHRKRTDNLIGRLAMLVRELPNGGWVYDGYDRREPTAIFKPIMVDTLAPEMLWKHAGRFLLMSGSIISAKEMADSLGIENYRSITVEVDWDPTRRPVYVSPVANVVWKEKQDAYPAIAAATKAIAQRHPNERVLIHTVNYDLTATVFQAVSGNGRPVFTYTNASERELALRKYMETDRAIIVAPSLDRGVDFIDDLARVQVICKVPFPSLGDKQVSTRTHMGRRGDMWFRVQTVRSIVQMIGRGMRHEDDWCVTYVLDRQMSSNVLRNSRSLIPRWVKRAMVFADEPWLDVDQSALTT